MGTQTTIFCDFRRHSAMDDLVLRLRVNSGKATGRDVKKRTTDVLAPKRSL